MCQAALRRARIRPEQIDIVSTHATGTGAGDTQECAALRQVFSESPGTYFNNAKSYHRATPWGPQVPWSWLATCRPSRRGLPCHD